MTPEAQQIAIAKACGWKRTKLKEPIRGGGDTYGYWTDPSGTKREEGFDPWNGYITLPDYPNDLNAMHEAEKTLTAEQARSYDKELQRVGYQKHLAGAFWLWHMTAAQRAEAFLKTLNLWTE